MKLVMILVDADRAPDVERILEARGLPGYTEIPKVLGKGTETGRKFGTRAFPGSTTLYFTAIPPGEVAGLAEDLRRLHALRGPAEGLRAFTLDTEELL